MPLLTPEVLDKSPSKDVQIAMSKDLRAIAKTMNGKGLWFVAAADIALSDKKTVSLFLVSKNETEAKAWHATLKGKKPRALTIGTCTLQTPDGRAVRIAVGKVTGDRKATVKAAQLAFKLDTAVRVVDGLAVEDGDQDRAPAAVSIPQVTSRVAAAAGDFFASAEGEKAYQRALVEAMKEGRALRMSDADIVTQFDQAWRREMVTKLSDPAAWQRASAGAR